MKAIICTQYGPPEVAKLSEVPRPNPGENEVLVKVCTATVNRTDSGFRSAEYFVSRFWSGLSRPKYPVLGSEFAGVVEVVGRSVTSFKTGDRVFGFDDKSFGGHAEYLVVAENAAIIQMPENLSFDEAAPISEGAFMPCAI